MRRLKECATGGWCVLFFFFLNQASVQQGMFSYLQKHVLEKSEVINFKPVFKPVLFLRGWLATGLLLRARGQPLIRAEHSL